jgi:hypothetical protein
MVGVPCPDRLPLALPDSKGANDRRPKQEHDEQPCHHRAAGAKRDVAKHVQRREGGTVVSKQIQHG